MMTKFSRFALRACLPWLALSACGSEIGHIGAAGDPGSNAGTNGQQAPWLDDGGSMGNDLGVDASSAHDGRPPAAGDGASFVNPPAPPPVIGACDALPAAGTWQPMTPRSVVDTQALTLDPFDIGTLWLGTSPRGAAAGNKPASGSGGLYKSTDCGATWKKVNTGANGAMLDDASMWSMAIDPIQKGVLYVIGAYGPGGLFKSTNGGVDWVQLFPSTSEFAKAVQYAFVGSVSMDPTNHLHLVVGTHGACAAPYDPVCQAETLDGGATWKLMKIPNPTGTWAEQTGPYVINSSTWLFATLFNGLYLTTDHGSTWKTITPPGVMGVTGGEYTHRPLISSSTGTYYLPSISPSGLLSSKDGSAWATVAGSPGGDYQLGFAMAGGQIYMGDRNTGKYAVASEAAPTSWKALPPTPAASINGTVEGAVFLEYDPSHHVLYSSNFEGLAWRLVTQ